jgi:hypothetical protein
MYVEPSEFEGAAERLVTSPELRERLGREARDFVFSHCGPAAVAERFMRVVRGDIPDEWMYDPSDVRYTHGWGLSEGELREVIAAVIGQGGAAALQVADKPELERRLLELAAAVTP